MATLLILIGNSLNIGLRDWQTFVYNTLIISSGRFIVRGGRDLDGRGGVGTLLFRR